MSLAIAPVVAVGWVLVRVVALAVRVALFRAHRSAGTSSVLWGLGFALFVWAGVRSLGLHEVRAIPFALVAGAATALFIYLRGAALDNPPAGQPGAFYRRRRARHSSRASRARSRPYAITTRELLQARVALGNGDLSSALTLLREAERVAVAQRKLDELLEVRALVRSLSDRSWGRTRDASERLAARVTERLHGFPPAALAAAGIRVEPERDVLGLLLARPELRTPAGDHPPSTTRELARARAALERGELSTALSLLQEARRVAFAQSRLNELLEVYDLVQLMSRRSEGRTHAASERLARKVEESLRTFAHAAGTS